MAGPVNDQIVDVSNNHWRFDKNWILSGWHEQAACDDDFTAQDWQHEAADGERSLILGGVEDASAPLLVIGWDGSWSVRPDPVCAGTAAC